MTSLFYTVEPGNTLWGIAQHFGTTVDDLMRHNNLADPNKIFPGQQLRIPLGMVSTPKWYAVRPCDTLFTITQRYGVDINDVIEYNNLENPNMLYPGQLIMLHNM